MRILPYISSFLFTLVLFAALPLAAQEEEESNITAAQQFFDQGAQFYYENEYGRAIVEFRKAQQAHPHPIFLYNIALASQALGRTEQALDAALRAAAMDEALPPEQDARNSAIIHSSQTILTAGQLSETLAPIADARPGAGDTGGVTPPPQVEQPSRFGAMGWIGVATLVVGAGALSGAAVIDSQIQSDITELESLATRDNSEAAFDSLKSDLEGQQSTGKLLLYSGAGLATVGAALVVFDLITVDNPDRPLALQFTGHNPGIQVHLRW